MNIKKRILIIILSMVFLLTISGQTIPGANPPESSNFVIQVSNNSPYIGENVTVTLYEIPYGFYHPEAYVWFGGDVYYGYKAGQQPNIPDYVDFILKKWSAKGIPADYGDRFQATFSFIPEKEGIITIDVYAHRAYDVTFANTQIHAYANPNNTQNVDGSNNNKGTPGFELVLTLCAIAVIIFLLKRKQSDQT